MGENWKSWIYIVARLWEIREIPVEKSNLSTLSTDFSTGHQEIKKVGKDVFKLT